MGVAWQNETRVPAYPEGQRAYFFLSQKRPMDCAGGGPGDGPGGAVPREQRSWLCAWHSPYRRGLVFA